MNVKYLIRLFVGLSLLSLSCSAMASDSVHLEKAPNNLCDKASLQRGAKLYMNYCSGCHSLEYIRFNGLAQDIGITDPNGVVLDKLTNENLNFLSDQVTQSILVAMPKKDAEKWYGVAPPDLSLVARSRGTNWLYTYLLSFYTDPQKPWGVNNLVFPDVGMPHILQRLQGTQVPVYKTVSLVDDDGQPYEKRIVEKLSLETPGTLSPEEYRQAVTDLVNFLEYASEPHKLERKRLGVWVMLFLVIFTLFAYLLKREFWKDVH